MLWKCSYWSVDVNKKYKKAKTMKPKQEEMKIKWFFLKKVNKWNFINVKKRNSYD